jgi:hypothetical protein
VTKKGATSRPASLGKAPPSGAKGRSSGGKAPRTSAGVRRTVGGAPRVEVTSTVDASCTLIEAYFDALAAAKPDGLALYARVLKPQSATALGALEAKLATELPADVRAFLARGLRAQQGSLNAPFAGIGFDFLDAAGIGKHTAMLRQIADDTCASDDAHAALIRRGFALSFTEPELVVADDGVYHFSYRNDLLRVAVSWAQFLEHWHASGCFSSHDFGGLWKVVKSKVASAITPSKNVWVTSYKRQFACAWLPFGSHGRVVRRTRRRRTRGERLRPRRWAKADAGACCRLEDRWERPRAHQPPQRNASG